MESIYLAANMTDAYLVRDLLQDAGIQAHVRGENLQGALGEIPVSGQTEVCVAPDDATAAREIVLKWERGEFALQDEPPQPDTTTPSTSRLASAPLAFFAGALCGAGLVWLMTSGPTEPGLAVDYDEDGIVDDRPFYSGNELVRVETDRNRDGKADLITYYEGQPAVRSERDDDFDGRMESVDRFRRNLWLDTEIDFDGDGAVDYRMEANAGILAREQWLDPEAGIVKQVLFEHGRAKTLELDRDGDGVFEIRSELDAYAEPIKQAR